MRLSRSAFVWILFQLVYFPQVRAQQSPDSISYQESVSGLQHIYFTEIGNNAQIYHGSEYIRNGQKALGFPYYDTDNMHSGTVSYQGTIYTNVNLYYNLVSDELVTNNFDHSNLITLSPQKTDSFTIATHIFLQLTATKSNRLPTDGYYEQLFSGEPGLYARRSKKYFAGTGSEEPRYTQRNDYYVRIKNIYYPVDGKNSLLDLLKDQQDVLKKYIHTNKLNFKKQLEPSLMLVTSYYSQLKH
jgi:hypothetical protein